MGARHLAAGFLALALALTSSPRAAWAVEESRNAAAAAVRDSIRALALRYAYDAADSLAKVALEPQAREGVADSILASIAEWRIRALGRGSGYARPDAWAAADEAILLKERTFGSDHPELARTLAFASTIHSLAGRGGQAESLAQRAVTIYERAAEPDSLSLAQALQTLGNARMDRAGYADARAIYERSIAIRERLYGSEHREVATGLNVLGILLRRMGEYEEAKRVHERAIRIRERSLPPNDPDLAWSLNNYANVLFDLGETAAVQPIHERVLAIRLRSLGPQHPDVGGTYNTLGNTLHALGDFSGARRMLEASLALREATLGPDHVDVAQALNNLAFVLHDAGDYEEARVLYERSLSIRERVRGQRHPDVTTTLDRLAKVLVNLGDLEGAKRGMERSLSINRTAFGDDHIELAESMESLAGVEAALGDSGRAEALYERVLRIESGVRGGRQPNAASSARRLAELRTARGSAAEACSLLRDAVSIYDDAELGETPDAAACWAAFGIALARSGRSGEALEAALRAEEIGRDHLRLTTRSVEEPLALRYAATRPGGRDIGITLLENESGNPGWPARVWDAVIKGRAAIVDELAARHRSVVSGADSSTRALADSLARVRERLARLVIAGPRRMPSDRYSALVNETIRKKETVERDLAERSAAYRAEEATRIAGFAEVSAALPKGAVLVAYVVYQRTALASGDKEGEARYGAFVLRGNPGRVKFYPLGAAAGIDSATAAWREEASRRPSPARRTAAESHCRLLGDRLRTLVWDPLRGDLDGATLILVVPDGAIQRVPLGALPAAGDGYLVQAAAPIQVLPAERDLLALGTHVTGGGGLLALGGPDFDAASGRRRTLRPSGGPAGERGATGATTRGDCRENEALRFAPLPGARQEAREIAKGWSRSIVLTGAQATEDSVKRLAPGRQVVHLATHGFFLRPLCPPRTPSRAVATPARDSRAMSDPLLRAGLAFAGSNGSRRPDAAPEDGLLTAEEIAGIDLRGVEWVVLSACDTGAGEAHVSEGLLGLRRAFQSAGARTVVVSLWRVDDAWTLRWMRSLYGARFGDGLDTAHAARRATIAVLESSQTQTGSSHPYFWGAFVAAGDWR